MSKETESRKQRPFPRNTLEDALKLAQTIQDQNNGKPMKRIFIADHLKIKPESTNFSYLISASNKYGLTKGNEKSEYIGLTPLGESVAKAKGVDRIPFLQEASQKVPVFQNFYQRYRDAKLPTEEYAKKLLKDEFDVPPEHVDECFNLIVVNGKFSALIREVAGASRVVFETTPTITTEEGQQEEEKVEGEKPQQEEIPPIPSPPETTKPKQIFIAHGKNRVPLEQLKKILDQFKVPYKVATDEAHRGRPIPRKSLTR